MAFSEEVAWVTGSSTGIGRAAAVALAGRGAGWRSTTTRVRTRRGEVVKEIEDWVGRLRSSGATPPTWRGQADGRGDRGPFRTARRPGQQRGVPDRTQKAYPR